MELSSQNRRNSTFPFLAILAGVVFVLAGLAALFHLEIGFAVALIFIVGGAAVVLVAIAGFRTRSWDIALFIISMIVFASVVSTNYYLPSGNTILTYSATNAQVNASRIDLLVTSSLGSINVQFSGNSDLGYQVVFQSSPFVFPFFNLPSSTISLANRTSDGILYLNASSSDASIKITIGSNYSLRINATTSTGSITMTRPSESESNIQSASLVTGTGNINAQIEGRDISGILLAASTGSVNFASNYLSTSMSHVPISVSSGTGSIVVNLKVASDVGIGVDANSGLGSISHNLQNFTITQSSNNRLIANAGNTTSERSFLLTTDVGTGSISLSCQLVSPT